MRLLQLVPTSANSAAQQIPQQSQSMQPLPQQQEVNADLHVRVPLIRVHVVTSLPSTQPTFVIFKKSELNIKTTL